MKASQFRYQAANRFGAQGKAITASTSLTKNNILGDGWQFIILSGLATLTLPVPDEDLWGVVVRVFWKNQGVVTVAAGFGGLGALSDNVQNSGGETCDFWVGKDENGALYWYAKSENVTATAGSSSSSSSSSSSLSSSSSSSSG